LLANLHRLATRVTRRDSEASRRYRP